MLKFIHTADWHLGNKMHSIERHEEAVKFLEWLKEEIVRTKTECLVISGDIFDTANPPNQAESEYYGFLASLYGSPCKNVIIIGGNHDSAAKLETSRELLEALNIHVVGSVSNLKAEDMVFELKSAENQVEGICAAVPFVRENEFQKFYDGNCGEGEFSDKAYGALYKAVLAAAEKLRGGRKIPIIATGHLYAADLEGRRKGIKENSRSDDGIKAIDVVGNLGSVHSSVFPEEFAYVALGHIHYSTRAGGCDRLRYSGSPFVMGFDECGIPHYVLEVSIDEEETQKINVEKVEVPETYVYKRISGDCATIKTELEKYLQSTNKKPVYVELYYKKETGVDIRNELSEIIEKLNDKNVYVVSWKIQDVKAIIQNGFENSEIGMQELKNISMEEIFTNLIKAKISPEENSDEMVKKYLPLFMEIANEAADENK